MDNYFKLVETGPGKTSREEEITTKFFVLVRAHYRDQHNVQFYADKLFVSRKYLSRVIKKVLFKTPLAIIHQVLVTEAKLLLKNSTGSVNQIAEQLNFADQAVFSKFFKKHAGQAPSEYRKSDLF